VRPHWPSISTKPAYGFLTNPFEATIATTPPDLRPTLPTDDDINQSDYSLNMRPSASSPAGQLLGGKKLTTASPSRTTPRR
jgi:hypothetical protein